MLSAQNIWLIDEGHAGHCVQSEEILKTLERAGLTLDVERIDCAPSLRGLFRPAARVIFSRLNERSALRFAHWVARFREPNNSPPAFIISSGGRTAFASRALALQTGAPNVFVGNPKPFPLDWFSAVLSPVALPQGEAILTGVVPNLVTPASCAEAARAYWNGLPPARRWSLLIGGASRNHLYYSQDWLDIAAGVNELARRYGIKWLISTSRRTGTEAEAILKSGIAPEAVDELVLYSREPKQVVLPFLGAGEQMFVTRDSLTMVSEAIMNGRPLTALTPRRIELAPDNFMAVVLRKYTSWDQYAETPCAAFRDFTPPPASSANTHQAAAELDQSAHDLIRNLKLITPATATM
jgi:hypothetical protein